MKLKVSDFISEESAAPTNNMGDGKVANKETAMDKKPKKRKEDEEDSKE